jgi:SAM-dependent methyltransferase
MTPTETVDWDKRYREGFYDGATEPHPLLHQFWGTIPPGPVVDIAMGNGRNAFFLAKKGLSVCGLDRSSEALKIARQTMSEKGLAVSLLLGDAGSLPFKPGSMTGVIVFYFLMRNIMAEVIHLLKHGGVLVYETFLKRQNAIDRHRNPDFLLDDGELITYFTDFDLLFYEETVVNTQKGKRATAKFVGRKR